MKRKAKNESSPSLIDIQNTLKELTGCKDQNVQIQLLTKFEISFEEFLMDTENQKLINKYALSFTNQMMNYSYLAINSIHLLIPILRILFNVNRILPITVNPKEAVPLFISIFTTGNSFFNTIDECSQVIEYFFKNEAFFSLFLSQNGIYILFQTAFFQNSSTKEFSQFINNLLFKKIPMSYYQTFQFEDFFLDILRIKQESISIKTISEYLFFISHLFFIMTHFVRNSSKFFIEKGLFSMYDKLVEKEKTENHLQSYKIFISSLNDDFSEPPNSQFIMQIYNKYQTSDYLSTKQNDYFQLILAFVISDSKSATKVNATTPFIYYFNLQNIPIKHAVSLFAGINTVEPDLIPSCIPPLFIKLLSNEAQTSDYQIIVNILENHLKNKRINFEFLFESGFVTVFFDFAPKVSLFDIFKNDRYFHSVTINIFKLTSAFSYQTVIFKSVLDLYDFYENKNELAEMIRDYLIISPSQAIITLLINKITEKNSMSLFNMFINIFNVKKEASENFVKAKGINWIFEIFNHHLIEVEQIANVLSKLVTFEGIPEIDLSIRKLSNDHQLFKLPSDFLIKIVYGENPQFPVIRTSAMIPFIPPIENLDPYNAWILGCRFVDQYKDNIFEMPMLNTIMNRFVKPELIPQLLTRPKQLSDFVDMKFDHFPLFQFFSLSNTDEKELDSSKNYLLFQRSFLGISFWFKFSEKVNKLETLFRTNNLSITITPKNDLIINCENTLKEVSIDPLNWCHIFVQLKYSLMQRMISVYVNHYSLSFVTKLQNFTFACFSHFYNGIMFLGPTIRFYNVVLIKQNQIDFRLLYKKGVDFMISFLSKEEEIFTPSRIHLSNTIVTIPDNCFTVPYYGFSMHFSSVKHLDKLIKILESSENSEIYDSLFKLILRIHTIDELGYHFFTRILASLKRNNKFLTTDHFISFLKTIKAKSVHIPLILYDKSLWKYLPNDILIESLFEYYSSGINWEMYENIELFLSTVVGENPSSKTIINVLLSNHAKIPKFMRFLISILKIAPTIRQSNCSWESVEFREETQIQHTILDCFSSFTQQTTIDLIVSLLSFDDLRSLMIVSPAPTSAKVFHLISSISKYCPNYIPQNDAAFITAVSLLSGYESVWNDILEMKQMNFSLHLLLIWIFGICLIHQNTYDIQSNSHIEKLESFLEICIEKCSPSNILAQILNNELCLSMIMSWLPFILHYNVLFQAFPESETNVNKTFEPLTLSQFPEISDPIWFGVDQVLAETAFPAPPAPDKASQFMLEKVTSVLTSNHFQVPFPPLTSMKRVSQWFLQSPLLPFLTDLILLSPPHLLNKVLYAFFFEFVIGNPQHSDPLTPIFFQSMLNRLSNFFTSSSALSSQSIMTTSQILQFLHILTGLQYLQDSSLIIISDLLTLAQLILTKQGNAVMMKFTGLIEPIILSLFSSIRINDYQDIFSLFTNNIQMFASLITAEKSQLTWIYVFFIASHNERKLMNPFLNKLTPLLKLDQQSSKYMKQLINKNMDMKSISTIEEAWKQKSNDFQAKFKQYYTAIKDVKPAFPTEIGLLSCDYKHIQFISNAKHYLISRLFSNTMKYFSTSFLIKQEQNQWSIITRELLENPKPMKKEHLSPFFFPYSLPRVLTPSPYPFISIFKDSNIRSVPIKLFKQNLFYSYSIKPDNVPNKIKMFADLNSELGPPSFVSNCIIYRYSGEIPSVLFMFNDQIKIICNCQLNKNGDDIDLSKEIKTSLNHYFIESVLIGHWGITDMFASKIVVTIQFNDLINVQKYKDLSLIIYSFTVGNFILILPRKDLQSKILKLKENIISNYSYYSTKYYNYDSNKKQKSKQKTLTISVPGTESNQVLKIKPKARKETYFPNFNWEISFNINETIQKFCTGKLSAFDTLLRINTACGNSFLSLENYPVAPKLNFEEIIKDDKDKPSLTNLQPISYFQNSINMDNNTEPLSFFGCTDFFNQFNLNKFYKLRESLESDSSKIIILNIISKTFNIKLNQVNLQNDVYERKNIGIVISELNSPLNFSISPALSTSVLSDSLHIVNNSTKIKQEQTEQMEEDQIDVEQNYLDRNDEELIEVEHTDEESNNAEQTDVEIIEEEEEVEEEKAEEKIQTNNNEIIKEEEKQTEKVQTNSNEIIEEEEEEPEEEKPEEKVQTSNNEIIKEEEKLKEEKQIEKVQANNNEINKVEEKQTEKIQTNNNEIIEEEEEEPEEEKTEEKVQTNNNEIIKEEEKLKEEKQTEKVQVNNNEIIEEEEEPEEEKTEEKVQTNNDKLIEEEEEPKEEKQTEKANNEDNSENEQDQIEEESEEYRQEADLSVIIKTVESCDISELIGPHSIPDSLIPPPEEEEPINLQSTTKKENLLLHKKSPVRSNSTPPKKFTPSTLQYNHQIPNAHSNHFNLSTDKQLNSSSRTLTKPAIQSSEKTSNTNANVKMKLKSKSITNIPERTMLFTPRKIYEMSGQCKIALFSKVDRILPLPKLSEICLNHFIVTIESIEMKIISRKGKNVFASIVNPHFEYASNINVSRNGLFLVVDTQLSISETYQIHYKDGYPIRFELKYAMPFDERNPKSIVDGETWSIITKAENKIYIWNLFRNLVYKIIDTKTIKFDLNQEEEQTETENTMNDDIENQQKFEKYPKSTDLFSSSFYIDSSNDFLEAFSHDEGYDIIWFVTKIGVYAISSSGKLIGFCERNEMNSEITAIKAINLPNWQVNRIALIGDKKGRIFFAYISYIEKKIEVKQLLKLHSCEIVQFDVNQDFTIFLSTDIKGNIFTWKI